MLLTLVALRAMPDSCRQLPSGLDTPLAPARVHDRPLQAAPSFLRILQVSPA